MRPDGTDGNLLEGDVRECPGSCVIIHYAHPNMTYYSNYCNIGDTELCSRRAPANKMKLCQRSNY